MRARYLLAASAAHLRQRLIEDQEGLVGELVARAAQVYNTTIGTSEKETWRSSVRHVVNLLVEANLGDVMVILEMNNLSSDGRIDMVLVGSQPGTRDLSVVLVENKRWSWARMSHEPGEVIHPGSPAGDLHPVKQVWSYGESMLQHMSHLHAARMHYVVNLHVAKREDVAGIMPPAEPLPTECDGSVQIFAGDERDKFATFLIGAISGDQAVEHLRDIDEARVRPNEDLMRAVDQAVRERSIFVLLDQQQLAVERVIRAVRRAGSASNKEVFIIKGGPGTGKSVLALELLGRLNRLGFAAKHASGSSAFAGALREHLSGTRKGAEKVFTYFNQHGWRTENDLDALVIDEGHRLRPTSSNHRTRAEDRTGVPQACELITAARVPVFLLDPYQVIRADEVGTVETIRQAADDCGVAPGNVHEIVLDSQFRHSRSPEYVDWVERLFGYHGGAPAQWTPRDEYDVFLAASPQEMEKYLRLRMAQDATARIVAGFWWPWAKATDRKGDLELDIRIGEWHRAWNAHKKYVRKRIPGPETWATDPAGFEQVGCIYTAQSFEWDYVGLIMGEDYVWRDGQWAAVKNKDHAMRGVHGERLHEVVRNTYRTLATRGARGAVLFSADEQTQLMLTNAGIPLLVDELDRLSSSAVGRDALAAPHVQFRLPKPTSGQLF